MNIEELRETDWITYEIEAGSHLYGINTPTSDVDIRGIFNVPLHDYLCPGSPQKIVTLDDTTDALFMEIVTYLKLITDGNPNVIDWLYAKKPIYHSAIGGIHTLIAMREKFITKRLLKKSIAMGELMIKRAKNKKDQQWKMLSHAQRLIYTVYIKLHDSTKIYSPEMTGLHKEHVIELKNGKGDYWEEVARLEQGLRGWYDKIAESDLPDKFPQEKLNELILYYKLYDTTVE